MARLAVRVTGDKSRRENITTATEYAYIKIYDGNSVACRIDVDTDGPRGTRINIEAYRSTIDVDNVTVYTANNSETHSA